MKKHLLTLIAMFMCSLTFAAEPIALSMGEMFTVKNGGDDVWAITPTETGVMRIVGDNNDGEWIGSCLNVFASAEMTEQVQKYNYICYEVSVQAGQTYYIKTWNQTGQDFKGYCVMAEGYKLVSSAPADGATLYISGDTDVTLNFTSPTEFKDGKLECNGATINIYQYEDYNDLVKAGIFTYKEVDMSGYVNYNGNLVGTRTNDGLNISMISATGTGFRNMLQEWVDNEVVKEGDEMTLTLNGVKSLITGELLGGDGTLTLKILAPGEATKLTDQQLPAQLMSYWRKGDAEGIATFTFSREIKSADASLYMGDENAGVGNEYNEALKVKISGNTLTVDFTGKERVPNAELLKRTNRITLTLFNVIDINGSVVTPSDMGKLSFEYDLIYAKSDVPVEPDTPAEKPVVTPAEGELDELSFFIIDFNQAVTWSEEDMFELCPSVTSGDETLNGYIAHGETSSQVTFTLFEPIVKGGEYTLEINAKLFQNANGNVLGTDKYAFTYTVTGNNYTPPTPIEVPTEIGLVTFTPGNGSTVESIQTIELAFENTWAMIEPLDMKNVEIKDATGKVVATAWNGVEGIFDDSWNIVGGTINFEEPITTPGTYTLVVPVRFTAIDWATTFEATYEVQLVIADIETAVSGIQAAGRVICYDLSGRMMPAPRRGIYIVNNKKILKK